LERAGIDGGGAGVGVGGGKDGEAPFCWNAPVPEITPPNMNVLERLTANVPSFVTLPTIDPLVPPSPSCRVPPVIVVPPV
jgi:hypothetical protein